jgi:carbon-monoxide dehydrogenase medium subunit
MLALRLARFARLVDLNGISELQTISHRDGHLRVGAMVRQATAERDHSVVTEVPLLARALPHIGHFQIRNRGTVGGSTAHGDPASELPAVALALDAEIELVGPNGARIVRASDFFLSMWTTAIGEDEVLVAVRYPIWQGRNGFAVREFARRHGDFALAGAVCGIGLDDNGVVRRAAIGLFGMGPTPHRSVNADGAMLGIDAASIDFAGVAAVAIDGTDPFDDVHATRDHRRTLAHSLVEQALRAALGEALNG